MRINPNAIGCLSAVLLAGCGFTIFALGERSGGWGVVRFVNATDRTVWLTEPEPLDRTWAPEGGLIAAHEALDLRVDRPHPGEVYEVRAFATSPGTPRPDAPAVIPVPRPIARTTVGGDVLLGSRSEGPLRIVLSAKLGKITLRVGGYGRNTGRTSGS